MRVESYLEQSAAARPDHVALVCGERRTSYGELNAAADQLAAALALRVAPGDRVAICLENSIEAVIAIFAAMKAGAVFVPFHPSIRPAKLACLLGHCGARALVAQERTAAIARQAIPDLHTVAVPFSDALPDGQGSPPGNLPGGSALAAILYTSGSTGQPKGVMHSHGGLRAATAAIGQYLENTPDDVILSALPLSFGYGLTQVLTAFSRGATLVLERSFAYPRKLLETAVRRRATGFPLVPTMAAILLQTDLEKFALRLRYVTTAAAAMPVEHIGQLRRRLPGVRVFSMYGQTECIRATYLPPEELDRWPGSVGRAILGTEVWVADDAGRPLPAGQVGELVVRGPHVMQGYWNMPEETARAIGVDPLTGGQLLRTGDLFRTDAGGRLYFVARRDDVIKTRGEKVSPAEVEGALCSHPAVAEAAVFGRPDPILGQAVGAWVVLRDGATIASRDLIRHLGERLEDYARPKQLEIVEALPKLANGKVDKQAIRAACEDRAAAGAMPVAPVASAGLTPLQTI